jgi:hypothetical protein
MMYAMWLLLGLAWYDGTQTASVWGVYREELRRLDADFAARRAFFPPGVLPARPMKR